jgi:tripartite-type tricarboxylate transporter receptor subunit TctC
VLDVKQVSPDQKSVLQTWLSINRGSNVYAVSKQTPADTTAALRQGFKQAVQNSEFKAAMEQRQLQYGYMPPEDIDQSVADLNAASASARDLMKRMLAQ